MTDNNITLDEKDVFEQNITITCDENDYIAFSLYNERVIDGILKGEWITTDWFHLNTYIFHDDIKHMKHIMIYLKYKNFCYRYEFRNIKSKQYLLEIEDGEFDPIVKINNKHAHRRDELYRYAPYIFCCGCCDTIYALDDFVESQNPNRECIIS